MNTRLKFMAEIVAAKGFDNAVWKMNEHTALNFGRYPWVHYDGDFPSHILGFEVLIVGEMENNEVDLTNR